MDEYEVKAKDFMQKYGAKIKIVRTGEEKSFGRNALNYAYRVTLFRNGKRYTFMFHDSIMNHDKGESPTEYDVLACLTKYDPGTIDDFVQEYGYEVNKWSDVKRIQDAYKDVKKEYAAVTRLFGDVIDELAEID